MLVFELMVLGIFMAVFQFTPTITILLLPLILGLQLLLVLGVALPLSVLNVKFKDTEFIWGVIVSAGFFLTPIFYQFDMLPQAIQDVLQFSPMVQVLTMAHHVVLYGTLPSVNTVLYSVGSILGITAIGYLIFRKYQARIAEEM
jgi:ABC-type polysaccharide/polyol phosphate export permease